jgi:DNA (cytosine-5)-methyltransferase 1
LGKLVEIGGQKALNQFKIGSLFDGSGGFPLAASMCGIVPTWASEVEPYPIAVTKSRFPKMKHLGDISKVNGAEIEPVDIITFGSPCQDLSVAGKRAGLKHEANGDEETTRSGLFMEAVRIIKEMREASNGLYPRFALWENVPGAFSSNKGEDFRIVLEELIKIVEPTAVMPSVPQKGWAYADSYCGDGWSLAYRVFDAQYWGVPQRRRRIHLVLDLAGECAQKVLFEREGLRGYFAQSQSAWEATTAHAEGSIGTADYEGEERGRGYVVGFDSYNLCETGEIGRTVTTASGGLNEHIPCVYYSDDAVPYTPKIRSGVAVDSGGKAAGKGALIQTDKAATLATTNDQYLFQPVGFDVYNMAVTGDVSKTLNSAACDADHVPCVIDKYVLMHDQQAVLIEEPVIAIDRAFYNQGENAQYEPQYYEDGSAPTLVAKGPCADCTRYIVRRLTPTECARLQGFADRWGDIDAKDDFTDEEYKFWLEVRNTHAAINGKATKEYTKAQMLTWYNKLHTDSAEYKMWGNGIALPPALYCMQGIADVLREDKA